MSELNLETEQYVAFKLADEIYGVDIRIVKTVEKIIPITRVPKANEYLVGVINLRGEIIPIIDLRKRFDMTVTEFSEDSRILVLSLDNMLVGAIVDCVEEVLNVPYQSIQNSSNINSTINANFVIGVSKVGDRIITILNFEQLAMSDEN